MKFSIIIPVYNTKAFLPACLNSVLHQSHSDFEVLLADDGSDDGESSRLCDRYAQAHPDFIRVLHKQNGGAGDARNAALPLAQGEYLLFLDSDDSLEPDALLHLSEQIERTHADVYYFGLRMIAEGRTLATFTDPYPPDEPLTLTEMPALLLNRPSACTALWRRRLFTDTDIRFRDRGWGEDLCMTRKMLTAAQSIVFLPEIYYNYLQHEASITNCDKLDHNREIMDALQDVLDWFTARGLFDAYSDELCKLCTDNIYDASVRILKAVPSHPLLQELHQFIVQRFPDFRRNPYMQELAFKKKLILALLGKQQYRAVHLLFCIAGQ